MCESKRRKRRESGKLLKEKNDGGRKWSERKDKEGGKRWKKKDLKL